MPSHLINVIKLCWEKFIIMWTRSIILESLFTWSLDTIVRLSVLFIPPPEDVDLVQQRAPVHHPPTHWSSDRKLSSHISSHNIVFYLSNNERWCLELFHSKYLKQKVWISSNNNFTECSISCCCPARWQLLGHASDDTTTAATWENISLVHRVPKFLSWFGEKTFTPYGWWLWTKICIII